MYDDRVLDYAKPDLGLICSALDPRPPDLPSAQRNNGTLPYDSITRRIIRRKVPPSVYYGFGQDTKLNNFVKLSEHKKQ